MFQLAVIQDTIKVPPSSFNRDQVEVLTEEVDRKYANRVVTDVGLGVCLYDFVEIGDAYLYPSDGAAHHRVTFRLMVFRPFVGEVLVGKVAQCNENGLRISLGFFDDIFVPSYLLQTPSEFDAREKLWVWTYNSDEAGEATVRYPMEVEEPIRFRVRSLHFSQLKQGSTSATAGPGAGAVGGLGTMGTSVGGGGVVVKATQAMDAAEAGMLLAGGRGAGVGGVGVGRPRSDTLTVGLGMEDGGPPPPMQIVGTTNEDGLGMVAWWG